MYFANKRIRRIAIALALLTISTLSFASISVAANAEQFQGSVELLFCIKNGDGRWDQIDKLTIPSVRFAATLDAITKGKAVAGDLEFQGKTASGRDVSVRALRPGKSVPNLTDGKVGLLLPLRITVNGKSSDVNLDLSTEPIQGLTGPIILNGHRLEVDQATGTVKFALVGSQIANGLIAIFAGVSVPSGGTASKAMSFPGQLRVAMQLSGAIPVIPE
jgi:hypothetical protein